MGTFRYPCLILLFCTIVVLLSGCTSSQSAEKGTIQLTSSPSGAEIYLDGQYRGSTPSAISGVEPGSHTLEFRYSGYHSWSATITVAGGQSQYSAVLSPASVSPQPEYSGAIVPRETTALAEEITLKTSRDSMVVGDSITFSGTRTGGRDVLLTIYGPGIYSNGIIINDIKANSAGIWSYTWNPGASIRSGSYAIIVSDIRNTTSEKAVFQVIGGGKVSVSVSNHALTRGDVARFSGICTSGAPNVRLVLSGPGQYAGGVEIGTVSVLGDKTWSFKYPLDSTMPTGIYTISVYDVPKTTSYSDQFSVGFA